MSSIQTSNFTFLSKTVVAFSLENTAIGIQSTPDITDLRTMLSKKI